MLMLRSGDTLDALKHSDKILVLSGYMLTSQEVEHCLVMIDAARLPIIGYGMNIAHVQGILHRSPQCIPSDQQTW